MKNLKEGSVVKFIDNDTLNGGVVIGSQKNSKGEEVVLINTLEGKNVSKYEKDLFLIKKQKTGPVSKKFLQDVTDEINSANKVKGIDKTIVLQSTKERKTNKKIVFNSLSVKKVEGGEPGTLKPIEAEPSVKPDNPPIEIWEREEEIFLNQPVIIEEKKQSSIVTSPDRENALKKIILGLEKALLASTGTEQKDVIEALIQIINQTNNINEN